MSQSSEALKTETSKTAMQKILDAVERVGNKVPHPVVIFLILIAIVMVLSHILYVLGATVSYQVINPETDKVETATTAARSLLTADGIRFMYVRLVPNFMGFTAVGLLIVAMVGAGVAEESGLVKSLDPQAGARLPALGADLHPGVRRHPFEHRRGRRLRGLDPAGRGGASSVSDVTPLPEWPWGSPPWPARSP